MTEARADRNPSIMKKEIPIILTSSLPPRTTDFLDEHPGGAKILKRMAGKDASKQFWKYHGKTVLDKYGDKLRIGSVAESAKL